mmetsp:Transcript_8802/g.21479  ORF Transcript_8802/g.21479 Transcript_8802/m.21479 type:complete len:147 (-) Transcript_8802:2-442(-)
MSFAAKPTPANASNNSNNKVSSVSAAAPTAAAGAPPETVPDGSGEADQDLLFKLRTFDVYWVEKNALMYRDGIAKTFDKDSRKAIVTEKRRSSVPLILRDMAPPEGSIFDPAKKWDEEKKRSADQAEDDAAAAAKPEPPAKKKGWR